MKDTTICNFLTVYMTSNPFEIQCTQNFSLEDFTHCSLGSYNINNQIYNVDTPNNLFIYNNGTTTKTITITPGGYSTPSLSNYLNLFITANGDLAINLSSAGDKLIIVVPTNYSVNFTTNTIYELLGFNLGQIIGPFASQTPVISPNSSDFASGIQSLTIQTNLVNNTFINGKLASNLYTLPIDAPATYWLNGSPPVPYWCKLLDKKPQNAIFKILDNNGKFLDIRNTVPVLNLQFKKF